MGNKQEKSKRSILHTTGTQQQQTHIFILMVLCKKWRQCFQSHFWVSGPRLILNSTSTANYTKYHDMKFQAGCTKQTKARSLGLEECDLLRILRGGKKCCYNFDNIIQRLLYRAIYTSAPLHLASPSGIVLPVNYWKKSLFFKRLLNDQKLFGISSKSS